MSKSTSESHQSPADRPASAESRRQALETALAARKAPVADRREHRFTVHNVTVEDPYAWLRDPGYPDVSAPDVLNYLEAENAYFEAAMAPLADDVEALFQELKGRIREDDESVPQLDNGYYYQWRFEEGAQYRQWWRWPASSGASAPASARTLLIDEPALAAELAYFRLGGFDVSKDNRILGYGVDTDGGERFLLRFRDLTTGELLPDEIPNTGGSPIFCGDDRCAVYVELSAQWRPYRVRLHVLGTDPSADPVLYEEADEAFFVGVGTSQSEEFLFVSAGDHVTSEVRFAPVTSPQAPLRLIAARSTGHEYDVDHANGRFYIRTNDQHENFRLVSAPADAPEPAHWQTVIAPTSSQYLLDHVSFENVLAVHERIDGLDQIRLVEYPTAAAPTPNAHRIELPEQTYEVHLGSNPDYRIDKLRIGYSSMVTPGTVYDYDLASRTLTTLKVQEIPSGYDASGYRTERLMAPARDGAEIPVSIVYPRDFTRDGTAPLHLYAYGAYGAATPPSFSSGRLSLLQRGFAYAIAHIRGGDEMGYSWYTAGKLTQRENTFNDFVDVARFLVEQGYVEAGRITISGGSAGGELMGAVVNQAPALWGGVVAHVPFVDVLNTMLDGSLPLTPIEWPEWGNPAEDPAAFDLIRRYSPYDQVGPADYPPLLVTAGLNDPRVTYWEPAKWVAKLRHHKTDSNPLLLKTNMGAGHGGKSGRFESLREVAEEYAFLLAMLDVDV